MKNENYINIQGWMVNELNLTGNKLVLFALIFGFSQDGMTLFCGSLRYVQKFLSVSKPTVISLYAKLIEDGLIFKEDNSTGNQFGIVFEKVFEWKTKASGKETLPRGKETLPLSGKETLPNNIYNTNIYNSIEENEKLLINNQLLLERVGMENKIAPDNMKSVVLEFCKYSYSIKKRYNSDTELYSHFANWSRLQDWKEFQRVDLNFEWFLKMFNEISKGKFIGTKKMQEEFTKRVSDGFTGDDMKKAVINMYSSDVKNKWHVQNGFAMATPLHLLKEGHLNKYLNLDY